MGTPTTAVGPTSGLRRGGGRKVRLVAGLVCLIASTCGGESVEPVDGGDAATGCPEPVVPVEPNPFDGESAWFVVDSIRLGSSSESEGFDVDCVCTPAGHTYLPADGPACVDNQFGHFVEELEDAGFLDVSVDGDMQRSIDEGRNLIILRMADIDDWAEDGGIVYLSVYAGVDVDADPSNNFDGTARLQVAPESLVDPGDIDAARTFFPNGILRDTEEADRELRLGDLTASGPDATLRLIVEGSAAALPIHDVRVVLDLDAIPLGTPPLGGRLVRGLLGGGVFLLDAAAFIAAAYPEVVAEVGLSSLHSIVAGQADLDLIPEGFTGAGCAVDTVRYDCGPGQSCEPDPDRDGGLFCYEHSENPDAFSVAFVFTAVSCDVVGIAPAE
ncbi:MAG: hypothetical protein JXB32_01620 [Deltaproteobacteria bacterium]|nr:hypothetical protein [Deltaproteobacteria bacterium]